jgi:UDP-2-acetamido-3-amino-2,3-dideoxy-glucuronate N-acetyltransferase
MVRKIRGYIRSIWFLIRHLSIVSPNFSYGKNLKMGYFNVILGFVLVGSNTEIGNFVLLKDNTVFGNDCYIDSYVLSSGSCTMGNRVILRYQSVIARNVIIEDDVFFTAGVKTIFLDHKRNKTVKPLVIKKGCYFGDNSIVMGGITVAENCIIGAGAFVNRDTEPDGIYVGLPATRLRNVRPDELSSMRN